MAAQAHAGTTSTWPSRAGWRCGGIGTLIGVGRVCGAITDLATAASGSRSDLQGSRGCATQPCAKDAPRASPLAPAKEESKLSLMPLVHVR
jgi:hypothetical protein